MSNRSLISSMDRRLWVSGLVTGIFCLGLAACGDLDDVTTIKDLRVLAIRADPPAFVVDVANPGGVDQGPAKLTALVVDPTGAGQTVVVKPALGCPDYLDTITAATGNRTRVCSPTPLDIPDPTLKAALSSTSLVPDDGLTVQANVAPDDPFTFSPTFQYGFTTSQLALFFSSASTGNAAIDQALANNRTFGLDAITSFTFTRAGQTAEAIKRVVYWPKIDPAIDPNQAPNKNPHIDSLSFFRARNEMTGDLEMPYGDGEVPELSLTRGDKLYVLPVSPEGTAEEYTFYEKDHDMGGAIVATKATELLRYNFFATAGTFSPAGRRSKLSPFFTSPDGKVHLDSEYNPPKEKDLPADGNVTIWVVVHDERAGVDWIPGHIRVVP